MLLVLLVFPFLTIPAVIYLLLSTDVFKELNGETAGYLSPVVIGN